MVLGHIFWAQGRAQGRDPGPGPGTGTRDGDPGPVPGAGTGTRDRDGDLGHPNPRFGASQVSPKRLGKKCFFLITWRIVVISSSPGLPGH